MAYVVPDRDRGDAVWVVDPDSAVVVLAASDEQARRLARMLEAVGFRDLRDYLAGGITAWRESGRSFETTEATDVSTLAERLKAGEVDLLDVREEDERREGHVEGAADIPYHELRDAPPAEVRDRDARPLAVACSAGTRSSLAVSLLKRHGVDRVLHVADGGAADLREHGVDLVKGD